VTSERWLPVVIFAALVLLIATPLALRQVREARRPVLAEVRIVIATESDPIHRTGPRHVPAGETPSIAVALRLTGPGARERWLSPVDRLEIDGRPVEHARADAWPERDRKARVFWFTVECSNVGGVVRPDRAERLMRFRPFLAPEVGNGLVASGVPEVHNDDALGPQPDRVAIEAGTLRLYARVEVFDPEREVRPIQSASTPDAGRILEPDYPAVHRSARLADAIDPAAGELFNLSGWEADSGDPAVLDEAGMAAFGLPFAELVERRIAVSSRTFAAATVGGQVAFDPAAELVVVEGAITIRGRPLRWGTDVEAGDQLLDGDHHTVLVSDDGSGILDAPDTVAHCWRRPPSITTLGAVLPQAPGEVRLLRHVP
jgi:hypothetical protein